MLYKERAQIAETERECNERFAEAGRQINERIAAAERKESHVLQSEGQTTNPNPHDANFAYVICCHCQYRSYYMCGCPCCKNLPTWMILELSIIMNEVQV